MFDLALKVEHQIFVHDVDAYIRATTYRDV